MSSRARLALAVVLGAALLVVSTGAFAAVAAWRAGSILVSVLPKASDEPRISLRVPAVVLPAALALVPNDAFRSAGPELRAVLPIAIKACEVLERQGDAVFVEVVNPRESVRIAKIGDVLRIDVRNDEEEVHVAVPISSFRTVVSRLERALGVNAARV